MSDEHIHGMARYTTFIYLKIAFPLSFEEYLILGLDGEVVRGKRDGIERSIVWA